MTDKELRASVLTHRQDTVAFHAYVDRMRFSPSHRRDRAGGVERGADATNP